ncbi:MFS transporter [Staphylococcus pseudintermedius]|uniref:MFS transporter n=1 Tax=Staphylococcus pseudintermedius TaxID=283734 RepID=UPI003F6892C4
MTSQIFKLISNDFVVGLGNSIFSLVMMWYVLNQTGSAYYTATIGSLSHIAQILVGSYAGIKADQMNQPVKMMVYSLRFNGIFLLIIGFVVLILDFNLYLLIVLLFLREVTMVFQLPNQNKLIPRLVQAQEDVKRILSYRSLTKNLSMMLGFAIAGFLFSAAPFFILILLIMVLFIIGSSAINTIKVTNKMHTFKSKRKKQKSLDEFKVVLNMILKDYYLKRVMITAMMLNIISMVAPTFVVYFNQYLHAQPKDYGMFQFFIALGSILAASIGLKLKHKMSSYNILVTFWSIMAITFIYMFVNIYAYIAIFLGMIIGICLTLPTILFNTYKILIIDDKYRGRISGAIQSISTLFIPLSYYFSAYITEKYGANFVYLVAGCIQLFIVLALLLDKKMKVRFNQVV